MVKCTFCGKEENYFKGLYFIKNTGEENYFCSNKCKVSLIKLKRDKRKIRWTEAFHLRREKKKSKNKN